MLKIMKKKTSPVDKEVAIKRTKSVDSLHKFLTDSLDCGCLNHSFMLSGGFLCVLVGSLLGLSHSDVVSDFSDEPECIKYFYKGKVPQLGSNTPGAAHLCQRFQNRFHFATLYDTHHRIAVYSAYIFEPSSGGGREKRWFVEPQVRGWRLTDSGCVQEDILSFLNSLI